LEYFTKIIQSLTISTITLLVLLFLTSVIIRQSFFSTAEEGGARPLSVARGGQGPGCPPPSCASA